MKKINIAIDGVAGSGKSTVAKLVAKKLGYDYIDTGSMYRCVALLVNRYSVDVSDEESLVELLNAKFDYRFENPKVILNGEDVTIEIRTPEVNDTLPKIVPLPYVRKFLVSKQQEMGKGKGIVMDGRDITSVVLKDAELKIYQTASLKSRADRRYKENLEKGIECNYDEILKNLETRDYVDKYVSKALVKVEDAIEIDTTNMTLEEVVDYIYNLAEMKVKE